MKTADKRWVRGQSLTLVRVVLAMLFSGMTLAPFAPAAQSCKALPQLSASVSCHSECSADCCANCEANAAQKNDRSVSSQPAPHLITAILPSNFSLISSVPASATHLFRNQNNSAEHRVAPLAQSCIQLI
jgi:hypothetical protein